MAHSYYQPTRTPIAEGQKKNKQEISSEQQGAAAAGAGAGINALAWRRYCEGVNHKTAAQAGQRLTCTASISDPALYPEMRAVMSNDATQHEGASGCAPLGHEKDRGGAAAPAVLVSRDISQRHHITSFPPSSRKQPLCPLSPPSHDFSHFHSHVHPHPSPPSRLSLASLIHSLFLAFVSFFVLLLFYHLLTTYTPNLTTIFSSSSTSLFLAKIPTVQPEPLTTLLYVNILNHIIMIPCWIWRHTLASSAIALSFISPSTAATSYVDDAVAAIRELDSAWYDQQTGLWDGAWWNSGNAFTILADFSSLQLNEANKLNIGGILRNTFSQAQKINVQTSKSMSATGLTSTHNCINGQGCSSRRRPFISKRGFEDFLNEYYDDEGWWALGLIRAHDATGDQDFLDSAIDIFQDMQTGKGTPCGGGIYWNKDRTYVNAIANELYLSVAASLANRVPSNGTYRSIAKSQWQWFQKSGMINSNNLINDGLDSNCKNNGLTTWSYNQGVILGGLSELAIATRDGSYLDTANVIANAAIKALSNKDGILVEADQCELRPGNCGMDGQQFKGIFVRNLRYLNQVTPNDNFKQFILRNAESIWSNDRNNETKLGVAWTGPYVNSTGPAHSSALDTLVAAIAVS